MRREAQEVIHEATVIFGVRLPELLGPRHTRRIVDARHAVAWTLRQRGWTIADIGRVLRRDHTSILAALRSVPKRCPVFQSNLQILLDVCIAGIADVRTERPGTVVPALEALILSLGKHFVGLWIYQPYGQDRRWCVTFRDLHGEYWETDLHSDAHSALLQALDVLRGQRAGMTVAATGQRQEIDRSSLT